MRQQIVKRSPHLQKIKRNGNLKGTLLLGADFLKHIQFALNPLTAIHHKSVIHFCRIALQAFGFFKPNTNCTLALVKLKFSNFKALAKSCGIFTAGNSPEVDSGIRNFPRRANQTSILSLTCNAGYLYFLKTDRCNTVF